MLRRTQTAFCSLVLMALLGACAMIDTVDPRYDSVNRSTAKARNESILLNIVRASHSVPLNFVAFTRVSGSSSVGANAGLPTFGLGQFFPPGLNILPSPPSPREFALSNSTLGGTTHAGNAGKFHPQILGSQRPARRDCYFQSRADDPARLRLRCGHEPAGSSVVAIERACINCSERDTPGNIPV